MNYKWRFYYKTFKQYIKKVVSPETGVIRDDTRIRNEYGKVWENPSSEIAHLTKEDTRFWLLNGKPVVSSYLVYRAAAIQSINGEIGNCESILELGGGMGFNLFALAILRPELKVIRGIELTQSGVQGFQWLLSHPPIKELSLATGYSPEAVFAALKNRDIKLQQGDIRNLPFEVNTFDCVFSRQVIEQLPYDYKKIFFEAFRVAKKLGIFIEEFREVQNVFTMMYLKKMDYFRYSYRTVKQAGFSIKKFKKIPLSKIKYNVAICVGSKK